MDQATTTKPRLSATQQSAVGAAYPNGNLAAGFNPPGARNTDSAAPMRPNGPINHNYDSNGPAPGNLAFRWTYGSNVAAKNRDPRVQVVQYNEDTFVMRQNVCIHWEAPFTYLLFGNAGALLIDTGATAEAQYYPIRATVDAIIARWCQARRRRSIPLTVVHTSGEDVAQSSAAGQFEGRAATRIAPKTLAAMKQFHGLGASWPTSTATFDLGNRIVDVIPTPGAHKDGISFYDRYTRLLMTGDLLFPGKINISNDREYVVSLERLVRWKDRHPVKWVMGGHVEMMFVPGKVYPRFANYKPYERVLQMVPALIEEALTYALEVQGKDMMLIRPDFILLNGVSPDQRTDVWPEGVPNISPPRPF
jgi:glyoxylase-like metal-dependent hydrolase (beta-lactamase superfamily II)